MMPSKISMLWMKLSHITNQFAGFDSKKPSILHFQQEIVYSFINLHHKKNFIKDLSQIYNAPSALPTHKHQLTNNLKITSLRSFHLPCFWWVWNKKSSAGISFLAGWLAEPLVLLCVLFPRVSSPSAGQI